MQAEKSTKVEQLLVIQKWSNSRSRIVKATGSGLGRLVGTAMKSEDKIGVDSAVVGFSGANIDWVVGGPLWGVRREGQVLR